MPNLLGKDRQGKDGGGFVNRRGVAMMSASHIVNDLYQGVVPAMLPFLVSERHYSYAAVAGLTLAATMLSSVVQPAFGVWTDRAAPVIPAGMVTAPPASASWAVPGYALEFGDDRHSGLGIAAFHPSAASAARRRRETAIAG